MSKFLRQSFSQDGHDVAVLAALDGQRAGFFVDLAANDPFVFSNSAALEAEKGWSGVCIDAAERCTHSPRRRVVTTARSHEFGSSLHVQFIHLAVRSSCLESWTHLLRMHRL